MHITIKHIKNIIGIILFLIASILITSNSYSEQSAEEVIKERKALFSKNYKIAKRVQALSNSGKFDNAKKLMSEMSENYKNLLNLFPENSKEGFNTSSLPFIWEDKENFNLLMQKSSDDMVKLVSLIETSDDVNVPIKQLMWSNCKACHSKYRQPH